MSRTPPGTSIDAEDISIPYEFYQFVREYADDNIRDQKGKITHNPKQKDQYRNDLIKNAELLQHNSAPDPQDPYIPFVDTPYPEGITDSEKDSWLKYSVVNPKNMKTYNLVSYKCETAEKPNALMFMFHGLNSWIGHGFHIMKYLQSIGVMTVGFDHMGFGKSEPKAALQGMPEDPYRAVVVDLHQHLSDSIGFTNQALDVLTKKGTISSNTPIFCMGLSMGGLTSYYLSHDKLLQQINKKQKSKRNPQPPLPSLTRLFNGTVLMAPAIKLQLAHKLLYESGYMVQKFINILLDIWKQNPTINLLKAKPPKIPRIFKKIQTIILDIIKTLAKTLGGNGAPACSNLTVSKRITNYDPFAIHGLLKSGTAAFLVEVSNAHHYDNDNIFESVTKEYSLFTTPLFISQGGCDKYVNPMNAFTLNQFAGSTQKYLSFNQRMFHDSWHEYSIASINIQIGLWIKKIITGKTASNRKKVLKAPIIKQKKSTNQKKNVGPIKKKRIFKRRR